MLPDQSFLNGDIIEHRGQFGIIKDGYLQRSTTYVSTKCGNKGK